MKKEIRIGCSAFNNKHWKGIFYPENLPTAQWFNYYSQHFDTYEMNGTFYKFPTLKTMENWYNKVPEDFCCSVKAPKEITHIKKFIGCKELLADFYDVCKNGLKEKLGYLLFQFPPSYNYEQDRLQLIIAALDSGFKNVIEFRHESWWIPEVWEELAKNNITFCSVSYLKLPTTIFTDAQIVYIRLHGTPSLFYSAYSSDELAVLKEVISNTIKPEKVVVYFNNTARSAGIENALELKKLVGGL